jgi:hypothetical protein
MGKMNEYECGVWIAAIVAGFLAITIVGSCDGASA